MATLTGFEFMEPLIEIVGSSDDAIGHFEHEGKRWSGNSRTRTPFKQRKTQTAFNFGNPLGKRRLADAKSMSSIGPGSCPCRLSDVEQLMDGKVGKFSEIAVAHRNADSVATHVIRFFIRESYANSVCPKYFLGKYCSA